MFECNEDGMLVDVVRLWQLIPGFNLLQRVRPFCVPAHSDMPVDPMGQKRTKPGSIVFSHILFLR
jgi:hypothetical protein